MMADDPAALVAFIKQVFDATGTTGRTFRPSCAWATPSSWSATPARASAATAFLCVYVADADATYDRAIAAGAVSLEAPTNQPYGDRRGMVRDPWGNIWQIATYQGGSDAR